MNTPSKILLGLGVALTLAAQAAPPGARAERLQQIHAGLTQDEVRNIAGAPGTVTGNSREGATLWIYDFTDIWGYRSELDVEFKNGVVTEAFSQRLDD
jgi:hypothetical protein